MLTALCVAFRGCGCYRQGDHLPGCALWVHWGVARAAPVWDSQRQVSSTSTLVMSLSHLSCVHSKPHQNATDLLGPGYKSVMGIFSNVEGAWLWTLHLPPLMNDSDSSAKHNTYTWWRSILVENPLIITSLSSVSTCAFKRLRCTHVSFINRFSIVLVSCIHYCAIARASDALALSI